MRPRLPLCLLPFVGALSFFSSLATSSAATFNIENYYYTNDAAIGSSFAWYAMTAEERKQYGVTNTDKGTFLTSNDNTFVFRVRDEDGQFDGHAGAGSYYMFKQAVTLSAWNNGPTQTMAGGNNTINAAGSLTFRTQYAASLPIDPTHPPLAGAINPIAPVTWSYVSQMGVNMNGTLNFNLGNTFNEFMVFRGNGSDVNLYAQSWYQRDQEGEVQNMQILGNGRQPGANGNYNPLGQSSGTVANLTITGSMNIIGKKTTEAGNTGAQGFATSAIVFADEKGNFTMNGGGNPNAALNISNAGALIFKTANTVSVNTKINITNAGSLAIEDMVDSAGNIMTGYGYKSIAFNGGIYLSGNGSLIVYASGTKDSPISFSGGITAETGGELTFLGSYFSVSGEVNLSGWTDKGNSVSTLYIGADAQNGVFYDKVTLSDFAILNIQGSGIKFEKGVEIKDNGTLLIGGGVDEDLQIDNLILGNNARIEVNSESDVKVNGSRNFVLTNGGNVYFSQYDENAAVVMPDTIVYEGGFELKNGTTLTLTTPVSSERWTTYRDNYTIGGVISGNGGVNLSIYSDNQRYSLAGANTYTGGTTISEGLLVATNETLGADGKIVSGSLGTGRLTFSNANIYGAPAFGLSADYNGTGVLDVKDFHTDIVIGNTNNATGMASATFVTGDYEVITAVPRIIDNVVATIAQGTTMVEFANDVVLYGSITDGGGKYTSNFIKDGSGNLTINGYEDPAAGYQARHNGDTYVNQGTLILQRNNSLINSSRVILNGRQTTPANAGRNAFLRLGSDMTGMFVNDIVVNDLGTLDASEALNVAGITGRLLSMGSNDRLNIFSAAGSSFVLGGEIAFGGTINFQDGSELIIANQVHLIQDATTTFNLNGAKLTFNVAAGAGSQTEVGTGYIFNALVRGAGDLTKTGAGNLILISDLSASYSGKTIVNEGSLVVANEGKISSAALELNRNDNTGAVGQLDLTNTAQTVRTISGRGILNTGMEQGSLTLSGENGNAGTFNGSFAGKGSVIVGQSTRFTLSVDEVDSTVRAAKDNFFGSYVVSDGAVFNVTTTDTLSKNATLDFRGVVPEGDEALQQQTQMNITGVQTVKSLVSSEKGSIATTINLTYQGDTLNVGSSDIKDSGTGTYYGGLSGKGVFNKAGTGTLTMAGMDQFSAFEGSMNAKEGSLILDGVQAGAATVNVSKGALLGMDITRGDVYLGTLNLGNGTLKTTGSNSGHSLNVNSMSMDGATLLMDASVTGTGSASTGFTVNGGIVLGDNKNTFDLNLIAGRWSQNAPVSVNLLNANLPIGNAADAFDIKNPYVFLDLKMEELVGDTTTTSIRALVSRNDVTFASLSSNSFGSVLDQVDKDYSKNGTINGQSNTTLSGIMDQLYVSKSYDAAIRAIDSLSGSSNYVLPTALMLEWNDHIATMRDRAAILGLHAPGTQLGTEEYNGWISAIGGRNDISGSGSTPGFTKDSFGMMMGADTNLSNEFSLGFSFSYINSDISIDGGNSAESDTYYIDAYCRYQKDGWNTLGVATIGLSSADTKRYVSVGDFSGTAKGSPDATMLSLYGEISYDLIPHEDWIIQPLGGLTLGNYSSGAYSESGIGDAGMHVDSLNQFVARLQGGARAIYRLPADAFEQIGTVQMHALILQDLTDISPDVDQTLIGAPGAGTTAQGSGVGKTAFQIGAGANVPIAYNVAIFANANTEFRSDATSINGNIGVRVTF